MLAPAGQWDKDLSRDGTRAVSHVSVPRVASCAPTRQRQLPRHPSQFPNFPLAHGPLELGF